MVGSDIVRATRELVWFARTRIETMIISWYAAFHVLILRPLFLFYRYHSLIHFLDILTSKLPKDNDSYEIGIQTRVRQGSSINTNKF